MNSRTEAVNNMVLVESSSAIQPVKYIVFNPPNNKIDVEKVSMVMKALNTYSSCNANKIPAGSSNNKPQIIISSTTKSTKHNLNPVLNASSSLRVNASLVPPPTTLNNTKPKPIGYRIMNGKLNQGNNKSSGAGVSLLKELLKDQSQGVILPKTVHITEPQPVGYPIINDKSIQGNKLRFVKGHGLLEEQFKGVFLPKTVPIMNGKPIQVNTANSVGLLKGHGLLNNQSEMVTTSNNKSCDPLLEFGDEQTSNYKSCDPLLHIGDDQTSNDKSCDPLLEFGDEKTGLRNSVFQPPDLNQSQGYNLNRQLSESNSIGLHRLRSVMNIDDPSEFAEFKKHYTLSPENKTFRNELLASTKKANFEKTSMVTILFNLVNICEKHVFDQNVHVQIIMNLVCEIAQIPECEQFADKILSKCKHILSETFNDMNAMVDQCAKLQTVPTKMDTENKHILSKTLNDMNAMVDQCAKLQTVPTKMDTENKHILSKTLNDMNAMVDQCAKLQTKIDKTSNAETVPVNNSNLFPSNHVKSNMIAEAGNVKIEPEDSENEVDIPMAVDNVDDENQVELSIFDNQVKKQLIDNEEIEEELESVNDNGKLEEEYQDNGEIEGEFEDNGHINEDNKQIEVNGQIERVYQDNGQIKTEMEEEEQIDSAIEISHIDGLNFNEYFAVENSLNAENEQQDSEGLSDNPPNLSDNEHENEFDESSEFEESETEVINEYMSDDPDWNPDEYFQSSRTSNMPKEPKEPKKPKEPKECNKRRLPKEQKKQKEKKMGGGVCHICGNNFKDLKSHMITHKTERTEKCPHCDFHTKCAKGIRKHLNIHNSEKNSQCDECGSMFHSISRLKRHLVVHSKELPFSCRYCPNKYKRKITLERHEKIHKEEYAFTCTFCDKKFIQAINLKTHMRTHTGEKPYKCDRCGEGFAHNVTKKLHRKTCFIQKVTIELDQNSK